MQTLGIIQKYISKEKNICISVVYGSYVSYFLANLYSNTKKDILFISDSIADAEEIYGDLPAFISRDRTCYFPAWEVGFEDEAMPLPGVCAERIKCLRQLVEKKDPVVTVTSIQAVHHPVIPKKKLDKLCLDIGVGDTLLLEDLASHLVDIGYSRNDMVSDNGDFAVRGGIIDIFIAGIDDPVRLELFGDEVESIRLFDIVTQRSIKKIDSVLILPIDEKKLILDSEDKNITDYISKDTIVIFKEPALFDDYFKKVVKKKSFKKDILPIYEKYKNIYLSYLSEPSEKINLKSLEFIRNDLGLIEETLIALEKEKYNIQFYCANIAEKDRLFEVFKQRGILKIINNDKLYIRPLSQGFILPEEKLALFSYQDIFSSHKTKKPRKKIIHKGTPVYNISDLQQDDFVVHINYGIGIFKGLKNLEYDGIERDYIQIEYKDNDVLYVPVEQINLIEKYIGMEKAQPKLHKLGGKLWIKTKIETQKSIIDFASELLEVQAKRELKKGIVFSKDTDWQREMEESFLFEETVDQNTVLAEVKKDMQALRPMDRLICGDVGFGKTEIAIRAAFKAVMDEKQVAILVPTTILAQQHYNTFKDRLGAFPVNVEMLSRFRTGKEQKEIIESMKRGGVDIIIGTHRLVSDDVKFKDIGLLIIDEEQRFGVAHKEKIKKMKAKIDVLTLTATPIPRTLYLSLTGIRDMSSINTPPEDRLPVHTEVTYYDNVLIKQAISRELARDGQVFFLHNRVKSIQKIRELVHNLVPYARVAVAHGQMNEHELEDIMLKFIDKQFDVLVCTTIIESGVDIPNVNTIIVDNADMFGLADLYQLRGRVGRYKHRAYAYFLIDKGKPLSDDARKRLHAINEFTPLGSGYKIALRDLEIRGTGNILGREQHGYIAKIGFDMYCSLLRRTIKELKGQKTDALPAIMDLGLDLSISEDYITDLRQRLDIYRKIAQLSNIKQVKDILDEVEDRFGKPVDPNIFFLLKISEIKIRAGKKGISKIRRRADYIDIFSPNGLKVKDISSIKHDKKKIIDFLENVV